MTCSSTIPSLKKPSTTRCQTCKETKRAARERGLFDRLVAVKTTNRCGVIADAEKLLASSDAPKYRDWIDVDVSIAPRASSLVVSFLLGHECVQLTWREKNG